ncbi:MAG TPA: VOC family protein [Saprospiraceae bacterium]|nr:VOC family protein [Saprospiraceae bacterium]
MKKTMSLLLGILATIVFGFYSNNYLTNQRESYFNHSLKKSNQEKMEDLKLGAFSISLSVKDLNVSKDFYNNLGFSVFAGDLSQNYLIMKNENSLIGLFQGMFEGNILTFNPGWDENAENLEHFDDVRVIQQQLKEKGIQLITETDEESTGPASIILTDPDGNVILIDQHR